MTAAHCVADQTKGLVLVNATEDPSCGTASNAEVVPWKRSDLFVHPRYTGGGVHDLAIIHLNFPVTSVAPAPLGLRKGVEKRCKQGKISGWGDTDNRGTKPCSLVGGGADVECEKVREEAAEGAVEQHRLRDGVLGDDMRGRGQPVIVRPQQAGYEHVLRGLGRPASRLVHGPPRGRDLLRRRRAVRLL